MSICVPSIPSRFEMAKELLAKIESQIGDRNDVELICLLDNKIRTIGDKRNAVKDLAQGDYFCIIDDDDDISHDFVPLLLGAIEKVDVDVITFDSLAIISGKKGRVNMSIYNANQQWTPGEITERQPFHMCAWKREKFQAIKFDPIMYGEDAVFSDEATKIADNEHHIDEVLHYYIWEETITEAFER